MIRSCSTFIFVVVRQPSPSPSPCVSQACPLPLPPDDESQVEPFPGSYDRPCQRRRCCDFVPADDQAPMVGDDGCATACFDSTLELGVDEWIAADARRARYFRADPGAGRQVRERGWEEVYGVRPRVDDWMGESIDRSVPAFFPTPSPDTGAPRPSAPSSTSRSAGLLR